MPTTGQATLHDAEGQSKEIQLVYKSWFVRQWGLYAIIKVITHWV
jgi:hypothetical protein